MIGINGVADIHVQGPIGAEKEIARRLLNPNRRRGRRRRQRRQRQRRRRDHRPHHPPLPIPPSETLEKGGPDKGARNPNRYATSAVKRGYFAINSKEFLERSATF